MSATLATSFLAAMISPISPDAGIALNAKQQEVWQGEVAYWRYANARDEESYLTLWAPEFQGWPCGMEHPTDFQGLKDRVHNRFADKSKKDLVGTPTVEAIVLGDGYAVTYLSALSTWKDEKDVPQSALEKIVHTWKPTKDGWKIVGGMCGELAQKDGPPK